jgi:hypothetical protein
MKRRIQYIGSFALVISIVLLSACSKNNDDTGITVVKGNGDINSKLNQFRDLLGAQLNTTPGVIGGHREINWDGVPADMVNKALPGDFFNPTDNGALAGRQRGLTYASVGGEFRVSNTNFAEVNAGAANQFSSFSGDKSFANISSSLWDAEFQVAGQAVPATVKGFGAVFADVDLDNTTSLEFFSNDRSLGKFFVPAKSAGSNFSFLGVYFKNEKVTRVRVGHDGRLNEGLNDISNGGTRDLIVMDDFLYDEPVKK